jgi:hypothetical protein
MAPGLGGAAAANSQEKKSPIRINASELAARISRVCLLV